MVSADQKPIIKKLFIQHIALPQDHGSWVFRSSPLLIGLFAANQWSFASLMLIISALAAFLVRQPVTILVKAYSGRRSKRELGPAWFWVGIYSVVGLLALGGLILMEFGYLLYLAIPGVPVFIWHLVLVTRRAERKQMGIELVGSGVLALSAPAAYWVGVSKPDPTGWLLFILVWLQSAASIVYAYLRLDQRSLEKILPKRELIRMGRRAILYTSFNLGLVILLSTAQFVSAWLFLPYLLQWLETMFGTFKPAIHWKPTAIGICQLIISSLFTLLFIITWHL